jgi:hypothetical protein
MSDLPRTSPEHYLTGSSAMTIPSEETDFVDWHFVDTFLSGKASFRVAGVNFPDTSGWLGSFGVRECGDTLRRCGVSLLPEDSFYAANRDRALLDLLIHNLQMGRRPDHLRLEMYCDSEAERERLKELVRQLGMSLRDKSQISHLEEWLAQQ